MKNLPRLSLALVSLLFFSTTAQAFVNAKPGTNIWVLDKGIADTVDIIQSYVTDIDSKIDTCCQLVNSKLDNLSCTGSCNIASVLEEIGVVESKLDNCCELINSKLDNLSCTGTTPCPATPIQQSDFVAGTFVITTSGNYCLAENVEGTITIISSYVTLNFNNFILQNSANGTGILVGATGLTDIVISGGGALIGTPGTNNANGIDFTAGGFNFTVKNLTLEGWDNGTQSRAAINAINVVGLNLTNLIFGSAQAPNSTAYNLQFCSTINIQQCQSIAATNDNPFGNGCFLLTCTNAIIQDSISSNNTSGGGFKIQDCLDINLIACQGVNNNANAITITGSSNVQLNGCYAAGSSSNGFVIIGGSGNPVTLEQCISRANTSSGFFIVGGSQVIVKECLAENNNIGFNNVDSSTNYLFLANTACFNTTNYTPNITSAPVTSPANALGADNIDCSNTDLDQINVIESKLDNCCQLINSKLDTLDACAATVIFQSDFVAGTFTIIAAGPYCLAEDVTGMIVFGVDSASLDLNSYTLNNGGGDPAITFSGERRDILIRNGRILGDGTITGTGVEIGSTCSNITLDGVTIEAWGTGIAAVNNTGLNLQNLTVGNSQVFTPGASNIWGAVLQGCVGITIGNSTFIGNQALGLLLQTIDSGHLENCDFVNTFSTFGPGHGLQIDDGFGGASFALSLNNCRSNDNIGQGFFFFAFDGSGIFDSVVNSCVALDNFDSGFTFSSTNLFLNGIEGIRVEYCTGNGHFGAGFNVQGPNNQITIQYCSANDNFAFGFVTDGSSSSLEFYNNTACSNGVNYSPNITSAPVTSPANALGADNIDCQNTDPDQIDVIEAQGSVIESQANVIISIVEQISSELQAPCGATPITQADFLNPNQTFTIDTPGNYCLATDVDGTILIVAPDVVLDLNGRTLSSGLNGIILGSTGGSAATNCRISNGTLSYVGSTTAAGIDMSDPLSPGDTVISNIVFENWFRGINVTNSMSNLIVDNVRASADFVNGVGLYINSPGIVSDVSIRNCHFNLCTGAANVFLQSVQNVVIADTTFNRAQVNVGIQINMCTNIELSNCTAQDCRLTGFNFFDCNQIVLNECIAQENSSFGIVVDSCNTVELSDCVSQLCTHTGFAIVDSTQIVLNECVAQRNQSDGFAVGTDGHPCVNVTLNGCIGQINTQNGFTVGDTTTSQVHFKGCIALGNNISGFQIPTQLATTPSRFLANLAQSNGATPAGSPQDSNYGIGGPTTAFVSPGPGPAPFFQLAQRAAVTPPPSYWDNMTLQ